MPTNMFLERTFPAPLSVDDVHERVRSSDWCFDLHMVDWRASVLSAGGRTMVCWFSAPDAESTRTALRRSGADTQLLWAGTVHESSETVTPNVLVERTFDQPVSFEAIEMQGPAAGWCLQTASRQILPVVLRGGPQAHAVPLYAPDVESVRLAAAGVRDSRSMPYGHSTGSAETRRDCAGDRPRCGDSTFLVDNSTPASTLGLTTGRNLSGPPIIDRPYPQMKEVLAMNETSVKVDNGVNVEALLGARKALTEAPEAARFKWRATCSWVNGTHSRSTVQGFFGLGAEQTHKREFRYDADHPEVFASEDLGATPVEYVLVGLASCLTAGVAAVAQNRSIQLRSVKAIVEAGMDIQGILGIDSEVRNGFDGVKIVFEIDADASKKDIAALVAQSQKRSAVFDIITNPTNVVVEVR